MRRSWISPAAALVALGLVAGIAFAADSPFEGTWKVLLPQAQFELNPWLVKIDKGGKAVEVVAGVQPPFKATTVKDVKIDAKSMRFTLAVPKGQVFSFVMLPPSADDKETLRGSVRIGAAVMAAWMEKTELTEIDPMMARQKIGALGDLEAALKKAESDEKIKELIEVGKSHVGRPVGILAYQVLINELNRSKAKPEAYKTAVKEYLEGAKVFGPQMVLGARLALANTLRANKETLPISLENAEAAVKMLDDDLPKNMHISAYLALTTSQVASGKKEEADKNAPKIKGLAEGLLKMAKADSERMSALQLIANSLLNSPSGTVADLGLDYARQAHKMVKPDAPKMQKLAADKFLRIALASRGKKEEAEKLHAAIEKVEVELDAEFARANMPFEVKKFAGRKGKSDRVVLVELFTGAQCPPCVSADIAFDAALKAYTGKEVALLQYHLHVPGPDPLTNADSEARQRYYGDEDVGGTPAVLIDGKAGPALGGGKMHAEDRFEKLSEAVNTNLETEAEAKLKLTVKRDGSKIDIKADVSDAKGPGEKLKLRFVLVEETARFTGINGQRLHHQVVRAMPGGAAGLAVEKKDMALTASVDLDLVRKTLNAYLNGAATRFRQPWPDRPMELKKLKVVAFLQDDDSKKVLQAVTADVPEPAEKK